MDLRKILVVSIFISAAFAFINLNLKGDLRKPLTQYVAAPDFNYRWNYDSEFRGVGYTVYVLNMTSQRYTPPGGANPELWKHWLSICVPDNLHRARARTAQLHIDSGTNTEGAPTTWNNNRFGYVEQLCQNTQIVTAYLSDVPSQPYIFGADPTQKPRVEDDILAYGWARLLNDTSNPLWVTRLAMVKSAVRAMDTVQAFALTRGLFRIPIIRDFIVSGASKRGWATWLTAAVDSRVTAIIPVVMPIQNTLPNLHSIFRCYGNWGFAFADYVNNGVTARTTDPAFKAITDIEDPINYNRFIDMPKLVIIGTKDEFFVPDQPKFFFDELIGEKHLVAVPNGNHGAINSRTTLPEPFYYITNTSAAFINQVVGNNKRPTYEYKLTYSNDTASVEFKVIKGNPTQVRLWQGTPPGTVQRDFRLFTGTGFQAYNFVSTVLTPVRKNVYQASVSKPAAGWTGFFIDAEYEPVRGGDKFYVTSEVNIVPDRYPFRPCYETNNC